MQNDRGRRDDDASDHIARLQAYLNAVSSGIFVYDVSGRLIDINETACRMHGLSRDEMLARDPNEFIHADSHHVFDEFVQAVLAGENYEGYVTGLRGDGTTFAAEIEGQLIEISGERFLFSSIIDVSERRRLEQQLRHAQRLEVTGQLAGGIAHKFNNLLMIMTGSAEILVKRAEADSTLMGEARTLLDAGEEARQLVAQLLTFARQRHPVVEVIDLSALAEAQVDLLRQVLPTSIDITLRIQCPDCLVRGDRSQLEHVLLNLCVNARDAMSRGGSLEVTVGEHQVESSDETMSRLAPGLYCLMAVRDTGEGMDADTIAHAFDPFFTTNDKTDAAGLGLSVVYGAIAQHGGDVSLSSTPGEGTEVRMLLPLARPGDKARDEGARRVTEEVRRQVLVVEDNAGVRALVERMLDSLGYTVVTATSAESARAVAKKSSPDVALLDMVLPDGSGVAVLGMLRERWPALPAVFMTGYVDSETLGLAEEVADVPLLRKPFQILTLEQTLKTLFENTET